MGWYIFNCPRPDHRHQLRVSTHGSWSFALGAWNDPLAWGRFCPADEERPDDYGEDIADYAGDTTTSIASTTGPDGSGRWMRCAGSSTRRTGSGNHDQPLPHRRGGRHVPALRHGERHPHRRRARAAPGRGPGAKGPPSVPT